MAKPVESYEDQHGLTCCVFAHGYPHASPLRPAARLACAAILADLDSAAMESHGKPRWKVQLNKVSSELGPGRTKTDTKKPRLFLNWRVFGNPHTEYKSASGASKGMWDKDPKRAHIIAKESAANERLNKEQPPYLAADPHSLERRTFVS
eukprot:498754-Amphidinium_carterae.1